MAIDGKFYQMACKVAYGADRAYILAVLSTTTIYPIADFPFRYIRYPWIGDALIWGTSDAGEGHFPFPSARNYQNPCCWLDAPIWLFPLIEGYSWGGSLGFFWYSGILVSISIWSIALFICVRAFLCPSLFSIEKRDSKIAPTVFTDLSK